MTIYLNTSNSTSEITPGHYLTSPAFYPDDCKNCERLAKKVNKEVNGSKYRLITDPQKFKEQYKKQIAETTDPTDPEYCSYVTSANYDVSEIDSPKIRDGILVFYVQDDHEKFPIPFRVTSDNPQSVLTAKNSRQILPRLKSS